MALFLWSQCLYLSLVPCGLQVWLFFYSGRVVCVSLGTSWPTCQLPAAGAAPGLPVGGCREPSYSLMQKLHGVSNTYFVDSRCLCSMYQSRSLASRFLFSCLPSCCPTLVLFHTDFLFTVAHINCPPQTGLPCRGCPHTFLAHPSPPSASVPFKILHKGLRLLQPSLPMSPSLQLLENVAAADPLVFFAPCS